MSKFYLVAICILLFGCAVQQEEEQVQPNFLLIMGEDMSWKHFSTYGEKAIETPAFDKLAQNGVLFENAYCPAPSCGPSRSSVLTGRPIWQLGPAASIYLPLPAKYISYQDVLESNGYAIGYAGKGWGPGAFDEYDRKRNAAGPKYDAEKGVTEGSEKKSYADNFKNFENKYAQDFDYFLSQKADKPFSFWVGTSDAHRGFEKDKYLEYGIDPGKVEVPKYFPDTPEVRKEIADYLFEVKRFDDTVADLMEVLKKHGKYENTVILVTGDHGWSFPRGKGSLYEYGMRVPLVVQLPKQYKSVRRATEFVGLSEIAPTFLELAGVEVPEMITTSSFADLLSGTENSTDRSYFVLGHERHSPYRYDGLGYPMRGITTSQFYYIENKKPERWPAGAPPYYADPSDDMIVRALILENMQEDEFRQYFKWDYDLRPAEELYDMTNDPFQLDNLADKPEFEQQKKKLKNKLQNYLKKTNDPRATSDTTEWDTMPWIWKWRYPEFMPADQDERVEAFQRKYLSSKGYK